MEEGSAFVGWVGASLDDILCEHIERVVGKDNCICFEGLVFQIPEDKHRYHYVKAKVKVHRYLKCYLAVFQAQDDWPVMTQGDKGLNRYNKLLRKSASHQIEPL